MSRIASAWRELVAENPMLIEISRFRRRFLSFSGSNALNGIVLGLALVCYFGLLMLVFSARGSIPPIGLVMFQTFVFTLVMPSMLYGAIAGEREKRTWDLLLAAPITQPQIIAGKFIGALMAVGTGFGLFLLPIMITAIEYERTNWWDLFLSELVSANFIIMLAALTLFFSARTRRGFVALGTVLAAMAIFLIVVPLLTTTILQDSFVVEMTNFFHPFFVLTKLYATSDYYYGRQPDPSSFTLNNYSWGLPQVVGYLLLAAVFLTWAAKTLTFAENDVRFIPANNNA